MISSGVLFVWFIVLNSFVVILIVWALRLMPRGRLKVLFLVLLFLTVGWINLIIAIQNPALKEKQAVHIFQALYCVAVMLCIVFSIFAFSFANVESEYKRLRFWVLNTNNVAILLLLPSGLVINGAKATQMGYVPVFGVLNPYFVFSILIFGAYVFIVIFFVYRRCPSELLRFQIKGIFLTGLISFVLISTTNGIIPYFYGNHDFAPTSAASTMFFLVGALFIATRGKKIFLLITFNHFLNDDSIKHGKNLFSLRQMIEIMRFVLKEKPHRFKRTLKFVQNEKSTPVKIVISGGSSTEDTKEITKVSQLPQEYIVGLVDTLLQLDKDNKHLALSLVQSENLIQDEPWLKKLGEHAATNNSLELFTYYKVDYHFNIIEKHLQDNLKTFGVNIVALSTKMQRLLSSLPGYAKLAGPFVISGYPGSGKSLLAKALHYCKTKQLPAELCCLTMDVNTLSKKIAEFLDRVGSNKKRGLLIRNFDTLGSDNIRLLKPLLENADKYTLYLTVSADYLGDAEHDSLFFKLNQVNITNLSLRDRSEDIFNLIIWYCKQYADSLQLPFTEISKGFIEEANQYFWHGNISQLQSLLQRAMVRNLVPRLEKFRVEEEVRQISSMAFSPLEDAERRVITKSLRANKFNKSKTARELHITMNTLYSKINKYEIEIKKPTA